MSKVTAACCRAMCLQAFESLDDIAQEVASIHLRPAIAEGRPVRNMDAIKAVQILVELPKDWEDWPEDAKQAYPKQNWEWAKGRLHATCKFLDRENGLCSIYERRPAMCRDYAATPSKGNPGGACQFTHCRWHKEGRCCPGEGGEL